MKKSSFLSYLSLAIFTLAGCNANLEKPYEPVVSPPTTQSAPQPREYYRDTVTLYIPGESQVQILEMDLNRRELADQSGFQHYYFLHLNDGKAEYSDSAQFNAKEKNPQRDDFLVSWKNEIFEDLSSRETYDFSVSVNGEQYDITLKDLQGDFLTKNTPEYTRYTSPGKATVTKNGVTTNAYTVLEKAYSSDDSLYVYFPGYEGLKNKTHSMHLWDEDGNYYYLDQTKVLSKTKGYPSHTWLLRKDMKKNITQKSYTADVQFSEPQKQWFIAMPDFGVNFELKTYSDFTSSPSSGPVSGFLTDAEGKTKKVNGWFTYYGM